MGLSKENWIELSRRFNLKTFSEKIKIIRDNPTLFYLESKSDWITLRLVDSEAQKAGFDMYFNLDNSISSYSVLDLLSIIGVVLK
jgi:hypothetical protein